MQLFDFIRHLKVNGCFIAREGSNHTIYRNPKTNKNVPVPRHREVKNALAKAICKQLEIPSPFN